MQFISHRIADKRILRLIKRFLRAGIQEDGQHKASETGTPQGGVVSPLLANIYLHYTLDLWFEKCVKQTCKGYARLIRYADDYVVCFQIETEARHFKEAMETRLEQFNLEIAPEKTQLFVVEYLRNQKQKPEEKDRRRSTF